MPFKSDHHDFVMVKERLHLKQIHYLLHYGVNNNSIANPKLRDIFTQSRYRKQIQLIQEAHHTQLDYAGVQQCHNNFGDFSVEIVGEKVLLTERSIVAGIVKEQQDLELKTRILDSFEQLQAIDDLDDMNYEVRLETSKLGVSPAFEAMALGSATRPKQEVKAVKHSERKTPSSASFSTHPSSGMTVTNFCEMEILSLNHIPEVGEARHSLDVFTVTTGIDLKLSEIPHEHQPSFTRLVDLVRTDNVYSHLEGEYVKSIVFDMITEEFKNYSSPEVQQIFRSVFERELEGSQYIGDETVVIRALVDIKDYRSNLKLALLKKYTQYRDYDDNCYVNKVFLLLVNPRERHLLNASLPKLIATIRLFCNSLHLLSKDYSLEDVWELLAHADWEYETQLLQNNPQE